MFRAGGEGGKGMWFEVDVLFALSGRTNESTREMELVFGMDPLRYDCSLASDRGKAS